MPDPTRSAPSPNKAERAHTHDNKLAGPLWARAVHHFYDPIFDIRSGKAFQSALNDFVLLPADERAFHETHLLYRLVVGLESVHGVLRRIEQKLDQGGADLSALDHLAPIREALEEIASGQADLVAVTGIDGEEDDDQDELGDDDEPDGDGDEPDGDGDAEDPDFIYDTVPEDEPEQPRPARRPAQPSAPRSQPQRAEAPREPQRPARAPDPEREALVGELVPASEGPQGEAGER